ncbi:MAG: hypothetical protein GWP19_13205 [Planctomycetia bacterium]|nr:hypothetical protein [Planctomycetia bacterium]
MKFQSGSGLWIGTSYRGGGSVMANGTAGEQILFTSSSGNPGGWKGIVFTNYSDNNTSSSLTHCVIENGGQQSYKNIGTIIYCEETNTPLITHCIVRNSSGHGIYLYKSSPEIYSSKIIENSNYGIYCDNSSHPVIGNAPSTTNDIFGNGTFNVYVTGKDNIDARYNYWGTTEETQIKARIYDKYDNPNSGEVFYSPWATESGGANQPPTAFSLYSPLNNVVVKTLTPTLTWQKSYDTDGSTDPIYTVQVGTNSAFTSDYFEFYDIPDETYTLSQSLNDNTTFYWRVKATDDADASTWSNEVWSFTINLSAENHSPSTPAILLPAKGEENKPNDYLVWSKSLDPDLGDVITYTIELDNNADFSSPEIHQSGISGESDNNPTAMISSIPVIESQSANAVYIQLVTLQDYANLQDDSTYYWRIKAVDNYGAESDYTNGNSHFFFNKINTAPQAVIAGFSPKDGLEVRTNTPEISWYPAQDPDLSDLPGTLSYNLELDDDGEFSNNYQFQYATLKGLNTIELPQALTENLNWFYRVQTVDDEGLTSGWSAIQNFWVNAIDEPPVSFALYYPENKSNVNTDTLVFRWAHTFDVDPYDHFTFTLQYSQDSSFEDNVTSVSKLADSTYSINANVLTSTTYYWRVKAVDSDQLITWGSNSDSQPWSFRLGPTGVDNEVENIPDKFALLQNYPNPFNPETSITFQLPRPEKVEIVIFNQVGQIIRRLTKGEMPPGRHQIIWDAKNDRGEQVASGIYLGQMMAGSYSKTIKMLLLK